MVKVSLIIGYCSFAISYLLFSHYPKPLIFFELGLQLCTTFPSQTSQNRLEGGLGHDQIHSLDSCGQSSHRHSQPSQRSLPDRPPAIGASDDGHIFLVIVLGLPATNRSPLLLSSPKHDIERLAAVFALLGGSPYLFAAKRTLLVAWGRLLR